MKHPLLLNMDLSFILATITAGSLKARMAECVESAKWSLMKDGIFFFWTFWHGDGKAKARSLLASKFLRDTKSPYLIFIDGDMLFSVDNLKRLYQDLQAGYDLIGGVYCLHGGQVISCHEADQNITANSGIHEFQYIGTGFMGISRSLLEKIRDGLPLLYPDSKDRFSPFFEETRRDKEGYYIFTGEDHNFCDKAHQVGVKSYIDTSICLGHLGDYNWTLDDFALHKKENERDGMPIKVER